MPSRERDPAPRRHPGRRPAALLVVFVVPLAGLLALLLASRGGVFRSFPRAQIDRGSVALHALLGAVAGAAIALVARRAIRRNAPPDDRTAKDSSSALAAVLVTVCTVAAITLVPHTPAADDGAGEGATATTVITTPSSAEGPLTSVPPPDRGRSGEDVGSGVMGVVIALGLAAVIAIMLTYRGRPRPDARLAPFDRMPDLTGESSIDDDAAAESFAVTIRVLLADSDVRRAVIAAYAALLDGLAVAGAPRLPHEAPEEHLRRALDLLAIPRDDAEAVTALFLLARFSTHPVVEADRVHALDALRSTEQHLRMRSVTV